MNAKAIEKLSLLRVETKTPDIMIYYQINVIFARL
jgi:hypothetical protein